MERKIIGFGEIVYDIIFKNQQPVEARPGGSILNMMVSLSRLGVPVVLIADMVKDVVGLHIAKFLNEENIDTHYLYWHTEGRSRLALAFLNEQNDADYLFYKMQNEQLPEFCFPETRPDDILIFGSYYAIKPSIRPIVEPFLKKSKEKGMTLLYDPNFRKSHLSMLPQVKSFIESNIALSTVTKGSIEDFELIFNTSSVSTIAERVTQLGCQHLIITRGSDTVVVYNKGELHECTVPPICPVSTIGAGDAFMAGLAYGFFLYNKKTEGIEQNDWSKLIEIAIKCSQEVCLSYDNYLPKDIALQLKNL